MGVQKLEKWGTVRCRLEIEEARLTAFDDENKEFSEKNLQNVTTFEREGRLSCNIHIRHNSCLYPPPPPPRAQAPFYKLHRTQSVQRRANARNISFRNS